ncbi:unnamed protein product [Phytophthora fragariaefolia]|uniref:Unnamed protein product n=1 Tax=Phytophthora fragariaefolia TaxID=1490495 RepID=A0A9W7CTZ6_9STRA|nr:unnamed protein product [Phytophthora fragariaefolia]
MVLVALTCALVGNAGVFGVKIDDSAQIWELKDVIKEKNPATITCDAKDLQLSLAKKKTDEGKGKGAWLVTNKVEGGWSDISELKVLNAGAPLNLVGLSETAVRSEIPLTEDDVEAGRIPVHVLVVVPEGDSSAKETPKAKKTSLAMMLKNCDVVGDLPKEGAFLNLFECTDNDCGKVMDIKVIDDIVHFTSSKFYVRKEILCVLQNFKKIYQDEFDTGKLVNKQMVLMGSPGTGKSWWLAG